MTNTISAAFPYQKQRRRVLVRGWPALTEKTVAGVYFVQEDSPDEIGRAIAGWMPAPG